MHTGLLVFSILLCYNLTGQDRQKLDSLRAVVERYPDYGDSNRIVAIVNLWRETRSNDLDRSESYARQLIVEGRKSGNLEGLATGYQRLGITKSLKDQLDSTRHYYRLALEIYQRNGNVGLQGVMLFNLGLEHQDAGRIDSALHYFQLASDRFATGDNPQRQGAVLLTLSKIKRDQSFATEALEMALAARTLFERAGDGSRAADADQEIAFAYETLGDYPSALKYHQRAHAFFRSNGEDYYAVVSQINVGSTYGYLDQLDSGRYHLSAALAEIEEKNFVDLREDALLSYGDVENEFGDPSRGEAFYGSALDLGSGPDKLASRARITAKYAELLAGKGDPRRALTLGQEALALSKRTGQRDYEATALGSLSEAAARLGDYRSAFERQRSYRLLKDSIYRAATTATLADLQTRYETERQERQIEEQRARLRQAEQQSDIIQLKNSILWIILVAVLLLFIALAFSLHQRLARNRAEKEVMREKMNGQQRELSTHTLHLVQKNQLLEKLHGELSSVNEKSSDRSLERILRSIRKEELVDHDWNHFKTYFREVHGDYEARLRELATTTLSSRELRLAALLKMGLNNAEVGTMLNVSQESLYKAKYRLRKKLPAEEGVSLDEYLQGV